MTQIWQQIRLGKHVGFEEGELADIEWWWEADGGFPVWPLIVGQLDFKPS